MIQLILLLFRLYEFVLVIRVLMSWISIDSFNPVVIWINRLTEPVLEPIRRLLPQGPIDFSPLIVLLLIRLLETAVVRLLFSI
ncbi:MAG: YggT family protein [Fibrobacter sp.]|nr:YggT family protein [Fibrobacter sp.]